MAVQPVRASNDVLRMAGVPFDIDAAPFYAVAAGFFEKYGITAELNTVSTNGAAIAAAIVGGDMDIGISSIPALAQAYLKQIPFTIIAGAGLYSSSAPIDALIVPLGSPLHAAKDLEGKTVAVNGLNSIAQYGPQAWIDQHGGDSSKVKFVEVPPAVMSVAMTQGRVDAAWVTEPYLSANKNDARVLGNCFDAIASRFMIAAFFTTVAWADAHRDLLRRYQAAMRDTARWANANHPKTAEILAKASTVDVATLRSMNRAVYPESLDPKLIQPVIDITARYGHTPRFSAEALIYHGT
jgi:NitT/TauT family transport system substrate-binding protein